MNVGSIVATLRLNISSFMTALRQATSSMNSFGQNAGNNLNGAANAADNLSNHLKSVERIVGGILVSQVFYQMSHELKDAADAALTFMQNMEKAQVSMSYFLDNAKDTKAFIMNMEDFAATTSFNTEQALTLSRRLMGAQFKPEQVRSIMGILNDTSAATGATAEQLDRIVLALTQLRTNGKIAGQELRQLAEAGIPIYKILSEQLGIAEDKLLRIGELRIPGDIGVQAVLQGLEEKYSGAADRIADTWSGMTETIRDDLKMMSSELFAGPYKAIEGYIQKIRDEMERLRNAGFKKGAGGIIEAMFSPQTQTFVRLIVGSIESIIKSVNMLVVALRPAVEMMSSWFTQAFGIALPILAGFIRYIAMGIQYLLQVSPALNYFIASVMTIMVVNTVSKALLIFWRVMGLGTICTAVANAVRKLADGIQFMYIVMAENPITALFIVLAGVLAYFALQLDVVQNALKNLWSTLSGFAGFDVDRTLAPQINDATDSMDKFDQSITAGVSGLKNVGKNLDANAAKAKKLKDLMSFDEVFRLEDPAKTEDLNVDDGVTIDNPKLKKPTTPNMGGSLDIGSLLGGSKHPAKGFWASTWDDLKAGWKQVEGWFKGLGGSIANLWGKVWDSTKTGAVKFTEMLIDWYRDGKKWIIDFTRDTTQAVVDWTLDTVRGFVGWAGRSKNAIVDWYKETKQKMDDWDDHTQSLFNNWVKNSWSGLNGWLENTRKGFRTWWNDSKAGFMSWYNDNGTNVRAWYDETVSKFSSWWSDTKAGFSKWWSETGTGFGTWLSTSKSGFADWYNNTKASISSWASESWAKFKEWFTNADVTSAKWWKDSYTGFSKWWGDTVAGFNKWKDDSVGKFNSWYTESKQKLIVWAAETSVKFINWVSDTKTGFTKWSKDTKEKFSSWYSDTKTKFTTWVDHTKSSFTNWKNDSQAIFDKWISRSKTGFINWKDDTVTGIKNGLSSARRMLASIFDDFYETCIQGPLNHAINGVNRFIDYMNSLTFSLPGIDLPGSKFDFGGGSYSPINLPHIPHLATGGIVLKDQLVRMGEGNKREAVVPLENPSYMKPFSDAVASQLLAAGLGGGSDNRTPVYVGTLIADDKSLRELERKMRIIRKTETARGVR